MDWVHCNNCYRQPGQLERNKLVITNCKHIYCTDCTQLPELKQCRICQSSYRTTPLSSKMTKEIEVFFCDPLKDLFTLMNVLEFQHGHRTRLTTYNLERFNKLQSLRDEVSILKEQLHRSQEEISNLRNENNQLSMELRDCKKRLQYYMKNPSPYGSKTYNPSPKDTQKRMKLDLGIPFHDNNVLKRPPEVSNFFLKASQHNQRETNVFMTPKISGCYRPTKSPASDISTPPTPSSITPDSLHKDPLHRKIKFPGDRGGPSPGRRAALQRVMLKMSKHTSTPKKNILSDSKYFQHFKN